MVPRSVLVSPWPWHAAIGPVAPVPRGWGPQCQFLLLPAGLADGDQVLMIVATLRLMRALARILAPVVIGGLLLGYLSSAGHGQRTPVTRRRPAVAPIERELQSALVRAVQR